MRSKRYVLIGLLMSWFFVLVAQDGDKQYLLVGKIAHQDSVTAVPFAFVASSQSGIGKETNDQGFFKLNTSVNDTLFFRCMGYEDTMLVVDQNMLSDTLTWMVQEKCYALASVDVVMFRSYASFRHMMANMDMMEDKSTMNMNFTMNVQNLRTDLTASASSYAKPGSGINLLAIPKLVGGKYLRNKQGLTYEENSQLYERFDKLTSRDNLRSFTQLNEEDLDAFIVFLRSKHKVDPRLDDYKMMEAIGLVLNEFLAFQGDTTCVNN